MKRLFQKLAGLHVGVKASLAYFGANVVTSGISYITTPFFTRMLSADEYGQASVYLTWLSVFGIIAMFSLSNGVFNNGMMDYQHDRDGYSYSMLILSNIITAAFAVVLAIFYPIVSRYMNISIPLLVLMIVVFLTQPAYNFWMTRQRYEYKYKKTVLYTILTAVLSPAVAIICIALTKGSRLDARLFGSQLTLIAINLGFYFYLARKSGFRVKTAYWKYALLFNLPLIPHYLSVFLLSSSDRLLISYLVSNSAAAYYSVAYSVAAVVTIVWTAANASLIPFTYENCANKNYRAISEKTLPILAVFSFLCLLIILLAPEIVAIMATSDYKEAIYVIPPVVGGVFFQVQYYMYANVLYYYKKPKYVMVASLVATILNLALNLFLIPAYGYIAAGYTTLFCYAVQAAIDFIAMRRFVGERVYNMKFVGVLSAALVMISALSCLTYTHQVLRYCIIATLLLLGVIFRKRILVIFAALKKMA